MVLVPKYILSSCRYISFIAILVYSIGFVNASAEEGLVAQEDSRPAYISMKPDELDPLARELAREMNVTVLPVKRVTTDPHVIVYELRMRTRKFATGEASPAEKGELLLVATDHLTTDTTQPLSSLRGGTIQGEERVGLISIIRKGDALRFKLPIENHYVSMILDLEGLSDSNATGIGIVSMPIRYNRRAEILNFSPIVCNECKAFSMGREFPTEGSPQFSLVLTVVPQPEKFDTSKIRKKVFNNLESAIDEYQLPKEVWQDVLGPKNSL